MNEDNEIIYELAKEIAEDNGGVNDWSRVSLELKDRFGIDRSAEACRSVFKRLRIEKGVMLGKGNNGDDDVSIEIFADGTQISQRKIIMSESDMKNARFVINAHGFDPDEFELVNCKNNIWTSQSSEDGEKINYQSKITIKPKTISKDLTLEDIKSIVADFKPLENDLGDVDSFITLTEENALEVCLADIHIGALSWHEEVGEDNDYKITLAKMQRVIKKIRALIELYPVNKLYICFLGDFFHIDTEAMTTTKGTKVDFDSRPKKMLMKGTELIVDIIKTLSYEVETEVYWVEGNHSRNIEFAVFNAMPYIFANYDNIKFDVSPKIRKAFVYGDNLIGLHHGEINKTNKFNWLQIEYREEWGKCKYAETHSGHIHHESTTSRGGITERSMSSPKPIDKYEYDEGYLGGSKAVMCYLWHKTENLKSVHYIRG